MPAEYVPTADQRALVENAAAFGITQADIAEQLKIDEKTLRTSRSASLWETMFSWRIPMARVVRVAHCTCSPGAVVLAPSLFESCEVLDWAHVAATSSNVCPVRARMADAPVAASNRRRITSQYAGSYSSRRPSRPDFCAAIMVVPEPPKGSRS
jgi:hypothetical protein